MKTSGNDTDGDRTLTLFPALHRLRNPSPAMSSIRGGAAAFDIGDEVEVRRGDGLRAAWYEATVARSFPALRRCVVVYASLPFPRRPSRPLRESVADSRVRPRLYPATPRYYALHQLVSAFRDGAWRTAVVSTAHGGDPPRCLAVCFPGTRDVVDLAQSSIRPYLEWHSLRGIWCAHRQARERVVFHIGEHVEVSGDREKLGAVWFPGTVLKIIANTIFLVEYEKPEEDDIRSHELVREILDVRDIRPIPPSYPPEGKPFAVLNEVEVCCCGGWVPGMISKIIDDLNYVVKLEYGKEEETEINRSKMRIRRNWVKRQWICATKHPGQPSLPGKSPYLPNSASASSSSSSHVEQLNKRVLKRTMGEGPNCEGQVEALLSSKKLKKGGSSNQLCMEIGPKSPTQVTKAKATNIESTPYELVVGSPNVEAGLQQNLAFDELCDVENLLTCNSTTRLRGGPNCVGQVEPLQSSNQACIEIGPKSPAEAEVQATYFESTPSELVMGSPRLEAGLQQNLSFYDPCDEQSLPEHKSTTQMREGPSCEGLSEILQPCKELKKGNSSDQSCMEECTKGPSVETEVHATDFERTPNKLVLGSPNAEAGLQKNLSFDELCDVGSLLTCNNTTRLREEPNSEGQVELLMLNQICMKIGPKSPTVEAEVQATYFESTTRELVMGSPRLETGLQQNLSFDELCDEQSLPESKSTTRLREGPNCEGQVEPLQLSNQICMEICPKNPIVEAEVQATDSESPPNDLVMGSPHLEVGLRQNLSFDEPCDEQSLPKCKSTTQMREGPSCEGQVEILRLCKELKKGDSSIQSCMEGCPKGPTAERVVHATDFKSTGELVVGRPRVASGLRKNLSYDQLFDEQNLPKCDSTTRLREVPSWEDQTESLQPTEELKKGDPSNQLCMETGPKTPAVETEVQTTDFDSTPSELVMGRPLVEGGLQLDELFAEQCLPKYNSKIQLLVRAAELSNSKGEGSKQLLETQNINHSSFSHETKGIHALKRRKKLVTRKQRQQEVADDVKQHSEEETKKRRGIPPNKNTEYINNINVTCTELEQPRRTSDLVVESKEKSKGDNLSNRVVPNDVYKGIQPLNCRDEVMACENSPLTVDRADSLDHNGFASQMASITQDGTLGNCSTAPHLLTIKPSTFNTRIHDTGIGVENRALTPTFKEGSVARSKSADPCVRETSSFGDMLDIVGNEVESKVHQSENNVITHDGHTSNMSPSKGFSIEETVLINQEPTGSSLLNTLPFVKSSPLWKSVESMEVFHIMRQEPHFRPLEQYGMGLREGMAIGLMVTFAHLVTCVNNLRTFDSQSTFEEILEALIPLKESGFNVQHIQSRIGELLEKRNILRQLEAKKTTLSEQIIEKENEKIQLDTVQIALDKDIMEVEQQLAHFCKKRDSLVLHVIDNGSQISKLQKDVRTTKEAYIFSEQQFDTVLSSPW